MTTLLNLDLKKNNGVIYNKKKDLIKKIYFDKNFMISIKENTYLEFSSSYWSSSTSVTEKEGCLIGLEYLLNNLYNTSVLINY